MTEIERIAREMVKAWSTLNDVSNFLRQADDKDLLTKQKAIYVRSKALEHGAKLELDLCEAVLRDEAEKDSLRERLHVRVKDMDLTTRTQLRLAQNNIVLVADLVQKTEMELLGLHVSNRSVKEIKDSLAGIGLSLKNEKGESNDH